MFRRGLGLFSNGKPDCNDDGKLAEEVSVDSDETLALDRVSDEASRGPQKKRRKLLHCVRPSEPAFPASIFLDPAEAEAEDFASEWRAVQKVLEAYNQAHTVEDQAPEWIMLELSDFTIYQPLKEYQSRAFDRSYEMEALNFLNRKVRTDELLVDGTLSYGEVAVNVRGVPFATLAIDGYGDTSKSDVFGGVSIQSKLVERFDTRIWYTLRQPSCRYQRYHDAFMWVANLAKHFVDFATERDAVCLLDYKSDFHRWLLDRYDGSARPTQWLQQASTTDFRHAIITNHEFLWSQHWQLEGQSIQNLPIWREIYAGELTAIPQQPRRETQTVVTPYVNECFRHMYFKHCLKPMSPVEEVQVACTARKASMGFASTPTAASLSVDAILESALQVSSAGAHIDVGDVVAIPRDEETSWKDTSALWLAYVQGVKRRGSQMRRFLDVIWLYRPDDTTLAGGHYPIANELFFSDNCNCRDARIPVDDVLCKLEIDWSPEAIKPHRIFVRQKYSTQDHSFETLRSSDFACSHLTTDHVPNAYEECRQKYAVGDTAYFWPEAPLGTGGERDSVNDGVSVRQTVLNPGRLEPIVIVGFDESTGGVVVRNLRRREELEERAEPNELVWTDDVQHVPAASVVERCYIEAFGQTTPVPAPFSRKGNGHFWFIRTRMTSSGLQPLEPCLERIRKSFIPGPPNPHTETRTTLKGLELFSGSGNFGRGVEDGGAVRMKWAVDMDKIPMHTYRANLKCPQNANLFLGSVDDYNTRAMRGEKSKIIAPIGEVDVICGGSPCRGLSSAQPNKLSAKSCKNTSLVAALAAAVDLWRPSYGLFENVTSMANNHKDFPGQNVFAQLLCCFVGMGYQVTQFIIDAWSCGAPQSRSRLFIAVAAPGLSLPEHPQLTHAHPPGTLNRSLGWAANGESFGDRKFGPTPFGYVSAETATSDLPDIHDGRVGTCVSHPDHRVTIGYSTDTRILLSMIPRAPVGASFKQAAALGLLPQPQLDLALKWNSKARTSQASRAWSRVIPFKLFPTVMRQLSPSDAFGGVTLHWTQPRTLTLMEARRAQGYPDDEVLVGRAAEQWATVGDAVCRQVAVALGVRLREAWLKADLDSSHGAAPAGSGKLLRTTTGLEAAIERGGPRRLAGPPEAVMQLPAGKAALTERDLKPQGLLTGLVTGRATIGRTYTGTRLELDLTIEAEETAQDELGNIRLRVESNNKGLA